MLVEGYKNINTQEPKEVYMGERLTRRIWALESGFNTKNAERDKFFEQNPIFLVAHNNNTGHLCFMPLAFAYAKKHDDRDSMESMPMWETTTATLKERSEDGKYKCHETASGTRYHLWQAGEITLQ